MTFGWSLSSLSLSLSLPVSLSLPLSFSGDRIIDTGISELGFTSASMGLSACGVRAVADTMTVDFMLEATSTLVEQAAKLRYMSSGATTVPMVMRAPAGNTRNMGPHHSGAYVPTGAQELHGLLPFSNV